MVGFADDFSDLFIVTPIKGNVLILDANIIDIIGGKNVTLNMSLKVNNQNFLMLGGNSYIKYTLDGSAPEEGEYYYYSSGPVSPQYQESYTNEINSTEAGTYILRAAAQQSGCTSEEYTTKIKVEKISTPTINMDMLDGKTRVSIISDNDAEIYYTTDGNTVSTSSKKYTGPFELISSSKVQAMAIKNGFANSDVIQMDVVVQEKEKPKLSLPEISYTYTDEGAYINVFSYDGADIYYTIDGSKPSMSSIKYKNRFEITSSTTVKALCVKSDYIDSDIASQYIEIKEQKRDEYKENENKGEPKNENEIENKSDTTREQLQNEEKTRFPQRYLMMKINHFLKMNHQL